MTTEEFSDGFDVLVNSYSTVNELGETISPANFDEYEKSVLLTLAQEDIVRALYNGSFSGKSFEETEELRRSLDSLIKTDYPNTIPDKIGLDPNSTFYKLKDDVWFITYESVELVEGAYCENDKIVEITPIRQDEWHKIKKNPFKRPNRRRVVRLDNGNNIIELISAYPIDNYLIRYLSKPTPIILVPLEDGISIDGVTEITECKLNSALHKTILKRAVEIASQRFASK